MIGEVLEERRKRHGEAWRAASASAPCAYPFEGAPEVVDVAPDAIEPDRLIGRAVGHPCRWRHLPETAKLGSRPSRPAPRSSSRVAVSRSCVSSECELLEGELADRLEQEKRGSPSGVELTRRTL